MMSYGHKYNDRRCCRQNQHITEVTGMSSDYDTDSAYTYETIQHEYGHHNITPKPKKHCKKDATVHDSNNEIGSHRSHNIKCPVYVHHMKMQKRYSQNDAHQNNKYYQQAEVYNCNKWNYYEDRTHFMKNKFDNLTLTNECDQKHQKTECSRKMCPVHHCCNPANKSNKKHSNSHRPDTKTIDEDAINKFKESYWSKWKPDCKAYCAKIGDLEDKMIRTSEEDCNKHKTCEGEGNLPLRCPDCFKCLADNKDITCLHKRAVTKESKSSDFVKSEFDGAESSVEDHFADPTECNVNGCDCPKSCPGNVEMASSGQYSQDVEMPRTEKLIAESVDKREMNKNEGIRRQECEVPTCPYVVGKKQKPKGVSQRQGCEPMDKTEMDGKTAKSQGQQCDVPTCPYAVVRKLLKSKKTECQTSGSCHNPNCPYVRHAEYETAIALEGQDVEEQLKITQYSNKLVPKSVASRGVNAKDPIKKTGPDGGIKSKSNDPTGDTKISCTGNPATGGCLRAECPFMSTGPEGAEYPVSLQHTDSFILNSIKQSSLEGKPHYKQPTTIKLSNTARVKGHSYPLKPILKKEKAHTPRKTLHSPKKPMTAHTKSLKAAHKKGNHL